MAGKVTAGLAESNGSLLPSGLLKVTCRLTACIHWDQLWAQRLVMNMGELYLLTLCTVKVVQQNRPMWCGQVHKGMKVIG